MSIKPTPSMTHLLLPGRGASGGDGSDRRRCMGAFQSGAGDGGRRIAHRAFDPVRGGVRTDADQAFPKAASGGVAAGCSGGGDGISVLIRDGRIWCIPLHEGCPGGVLQCKQEAVRIWIKKLAEAYKGGQWRDRKNIKYGKDRNYRHDESTIL